MSQIVGDSGKDGRQSTSPRDIAEKIGRERLVQGEFKPVQVRPIKSWAGFEDRLGECLSRTAATSREHGFGLLEDNASELVAESSNHIIIPPDEMPRGSLHTHPGNIAFSIKLTRVTKTDGSDRIEADDNSGDALSMLSHILTKPEGYSCFVTSPDVKDEQGNNYLLRVDGIHEKKVETHPIANKLSVVYESEKKRDFLHGLLSQEGELFDSAISIIDLSD